MKYRVITTKYMVGEIVVNAKDKDEAQQKAYDVAKNNEFKWHEEEKIDIHEIYEVPVFCKNCNAKLSPDSFFCNKCGTKLEEEIDLGRIYSVYFDKNCQTTSLLDNFHSGLNGESYDTLMLRSFFCVWKTILENKEYKAVDATVSLYIKEFLKKESPSVINSNMTITSIKNKYCDKYISSNIEPDDSLYSKLYSEIANAFINQKYNSNGDFLFENPISFQAQNNHKRDDGFGRTSTYYIVGVNFKI